MKSDERTGLILRLAGEVGMRRGEISVGHSEHLLSTDSGPSILVFGKGGKTRIVPLSIDLAYDLRARPSGYFFLGKIDGHLSGRRVSELAKERLPERWTIHKLRRMFATRSFAGSKDLVAVQRMLGHASITTTTIYFQSNFEEMRAIVEAVAVRYLDAAADASIRQTLSKKCIV